ncbi:MAG: RsmB/NOP family class I SAM-dependent RNA methyltransferase [Deltaproteobacteria bacterium]|nr:RsmB/NOP family class I SAM-dependent RNA methyltransferase [Deltaproteobacteria bacterium]
MTFERYRDFIPDFDHFLKVLELEPKPVIRVNALKCSPDALVDRLDRKGVILRPLGIRPYLFEYPASETPGSTLEFLSGWYHIQSLSSHVPVWVLAPEENESILDLCASPGSKTSLLAQEMRNSGSILANEKRTSRLRPLLNTLIRLGVANTVVCTYNGEEFPKRVAFDRVLVDAPCSGEGNVRIRPGAFLDHTDGAGKHLPELQKRLLVRGFDVLKPGGRLVYSTCTFNPEENEGVVAHLLTVRDAIVERIDQPLPHSPGITGYGNVIYGNELAKCIRIYPHQIRTGGFFIASVVKPGNTC